jgi:hypothetical protein
MAGVVELVAVGVIVVFAIGAVFGVIFIVVAGIKAEENVARRRRATTLYGQPSSAMNRGVRKLLTGTRG